MNCVDIDQILSDGTDPGELLACSEVSQHIAACPNCRAALEFLRSPIAMPEARLPVPSDLRPVRPLPGAVIMAAGFLAVASAIVAGSLGLLGLRGWRLMPAWQNTLFAGYAILSCVALIPALVWCMRPGARRWVPPILAPLVIFAGHLVFTLLYPWNGAAVKPGLQCLGIGLAVGLAATAGGVAIIRQGYPLHPLLSGLLAGSVGALCAALALTLFCPHQTANHLVLSHGLAVALALVMGMLARPAFRQPA